MLRIALPVLSLSAAAVAAQAAPFDAAAVVFDEDTCVRHLADLDGDGRLDAIGWWPINTAQHDLRVRALRRDAQGNWTPMWTQTETILSANQPWADSPMVVADFNGDGRSDWAMGLGRQVRVFHSNPAGVPELAFSAPTPSAANFLVAADFDGDTRVDLGVRVGNTVQVWRNTASGFVVAATADLGAMTVPLEMHAGELDGDGHADLLLCDAGQLLGFALHGASLLPCLQAFHSLSHPMVAIGDIDGDVDQDVVVFGMEPDRYRVLRRTGPNQFSVELPVVGGPATNLVDVDGDGDLDGVCCGGGGGIYPLPNTYRAWFRVSRNDGGVFAPAFAIPSLGGVHIAGVDDVDGDGYRDLISGRSIYYARRSLLRDPFDTKTLPQRMFSDGDLHDVDGDGDPDVGFAADRWLRNDGAGANQEVATVLPSAPPGTRYEPSGLPIDFDGDGDADLLVVHTAGATVLGTRCLANRGGALFDVGLANVGSMAPFGFAYTDGSSSRAVDLDGDGDLDLLVATSYGTSPQHTVCWLNQGGGRFVVGQRLDAFIAMQSLDLDGDGWLDLVGESNGFLAVRFGTASGFVAGAPFNANVLAAYGSIAVFDFDLDGDLDVVGGKYMATTGEFAVHRNDGGRVFVRTNPLPQLGTVQGVAEARWADFDGDGENELLAGPVKNSHGLQLLRRSGSGWVAVAHQIVAGARPADFDGDGDLDLWVGGQLMRGMRHAGSDAGVRQQFGVGCACAGGVTPSLGATGPFRSGATATFRISGGVGGGLGIFTFGTRRIDLANQPFPGMTLYPDPAVILTLPLSGAPGQPGAGAGALPFVIPGLQGLVVHHQAFVFDPLVPTTLSATQGLTIGYGR